MSHKAPKGQPQTVPRAALIGAGILVSMSLIMATLAQVFGFNAAPAPESRSVASVLLRFEDRPNGGIAVRDARSDAMIEVLPPGSNGFIRGALRGLARERWRHDRGATAPFRLFERADGRLALTDTATSKTIYLDAFGRTNRAAFAQLLAKGSARR